LNWASAHSQAVQAPYQQFFTPTVAVTYLNDDNLFRLPSGATPPPFDGRDPRGDQSEITDVGFIFDEPFGQQRVILNVDFAKYDYNAYKYLDFVGKNGTFDYLWTITPEITGHVLYSRNQSLNSFTEFTTFGRNINTNSTRRIDADWAIAGALHVGGAVYQFVQTNTLPVFDYENVRINSVEGNVNLVSLASNSFGAYGRSANGDYLDVASVPAAQIETNFTEHEIGLRASYAVDGQTNFFAQLGYLSRDNAHYDSRNFSGLVGTAKWDWQFTEKTSGNVTVSRSLSTYVSDTSSYVVTNKVSLGPTWSISPKVNLSLVAQDTQFQFKGPITQAPSLRDDQIRALVLKAVWSPVREFTLTPSFIYSNRRSNQPDLGFNDNLFSIVAKLSF
jgi:exopolysaccharide biosynthesis operon protein EpsL